MTARYLAVTGGVVLVSVAD